MKKTLILFLAVLAACGDPTVVQSGASGFVNLDSLVGGQVRLLDSLRPEIQKDIRISEQTESFATRRVDWGKEMAVFRELDISKPGLRGSYAVSQPTAGVQLFSRKSGENTPVHWLKITYAGEKITSIEGVTGRSNYLYDSEKRLKIRLDASGTLAGYQIASRKKILFGSEERLAINGRLSEE